MKLLRKSVVLLLALLLTGSVLLSGCSFVSDSSGQHTSEVVISEVMSNNISTIADSDGEYSDYIVLYNQGQSRVNLTGWHLTDSVTKPLKWQLPSVYINAGEYLIIFASGKDKNDTSAGVYHTNFSLKALGETVALVSPAGAVVQQLEVPQLPADIAYGLVQQGEQQGKYRYFASGMPGKMNTSANAQTLSELMGSGGGQLIVTEYMNNNYCAVKDNYGKYSDFVEIMNISQEPCSLAGLYLSDKEDQPQKWAIPGGIILEPGQRITVWCSGRDEYKDNAMHASFSLGSGDKVFTIADEHGALASCELEYLPKNISKGVSEAERSKWQYFAKATPGAENSTAAYDDLAAACSLKGKGVWINEVSSVATAEGSYDWIELYNGSGSDVSLSGWKIYDDLAAEGYTFGNVTIKAGGYMILYASGGTPSKTTSGSIYLPFKIKNSGTDLYLTDTDGYAVDFFSTGRLCIGYTSGRKGESAERMFFDKPTPGAVNAAGYKSYAAAPAISAGGYVSIGDKITASGLEGQTLRYTLDGSTPTASSAVFNTLTISKTVVIKVRAFQDGCLPSETVTATYVVGKHDIPFVSLSAEPDDLFGNSNGILANGPGYGGNFPYFGANFWKDWERGATFEYYTADGKNALCFDAGIKVFGQYSRAYDQKSMAVHLRDQYGTSDVTYPFFEENSVTTLSHLVLRAGGQDQKQTRIRDAFCAQVMKGHTTLAIMDWTPVAVYINGQYWGFFDLREKVNEDYFESHYGLDGDNMTIIKGDSKIISGSNTEIKALYAYVKSHDLSKSEYYDYVSSVMDIDNFIDYLITEIFFANGDTGNKKCYKENTEGSKWKWVMFDFDMSMRSESLWGDRYNTIEMLFNPNGHGSNNGFTTCLQTNLIKNAGFKEKFIARYAELLNTLFMPDNMKSVLKGMTDKIGSEMKLHGERWNRPSYSAWQAEVVGLNNIIDKRRNIAKNQLIAFMGISQSKAAELFPNG